MTNGLSFRHGASKGFTVMEVLVVILLVSLMSGVLMQAGIQVLKLRKWFLVVSHHQTANRLQSHWFRSVTAALTPGRQEDNTVFSGRSDHFQGMTLDALTDMTGIPVRVALDLISRDGSIVLRYRQDDGTEWEIGQWDASHAGFFFLNAMGKGYTEWPSEDDAPQLPEAILLRVETAETPMVRYVDISGRTDPGPRFGGLFH